MAEVLEHGFTHGQGFVDIPVDAIVEEFIGRETLWPKVVRIAESTLGATEVRVAQVLVECFGEHWAGRHPVNECRNLESVHLRHYVFQAVAD